jgi:Asp-tRNA(Asn)/Glu-tRNA(Gln) amidotransferase A subunit family amidase
MTNGIKRYRPASELKDHHDLIRIAAGIRTSDRRPPGLKRQMVRHVTELLKLFAQDPTLGVPDPSREAEEKRRAEEKRLAKEQRARSRALEDQVRKAEAAADVSGGVPDYGMIRAAAEALVEDCRAFAADRMTFAAFHERTGLSVRAGRILGGFEPTEAITLDALARRAGSRRMAREIEKAFADRGVTILPRSPDGPLSRAG